MYLFICADLCALVRLGPYPRSFRSVIRNNNPAQITNTLATTMVMEGAWLHFSSLDTEVYECTLLYIPSFS